jgi:hypothetical protein
MTARLEFRETPDNEAVRFGANAVEDDIIWNARQDRIRPGALS